MKIFDLHTHVLPGVDDGAQTMAESMAMLHNAAASNVLALVATPHCNTVLGYANYRSAEMIQRFRNLFQAAEAEGITIKLLMGMEAHATEELPQLLRQGKLIPLNGSRYLLTEFHPHHSRAYMREMLGQLLAEGCVPLIAHPERYGAVREDPACMEEFFQMGCHAQITAGSIMGKFGRDVKQAADWLLTRDLVACVASDAHGIRLRTNFLGDVYTHLELRYSQSYARMLLWDNPLRICQDQTL